MRLVQVYPNQFRPIEAHDRERVMKYPRSPRLLREQSSQQPVRYLAIRSRVKRLIAALNL